MTSTTVNHVNVELAEATVKEIAAIAAALEAHAAAEKNRGASGE